MYNRLGNTSNLKNSGGHTIKFLRPQQNVQKINTSVPLLTPPRRDPP